MKEFLKDLWENTLKAILYTCRIILCLIIVGLYGFLCYEIIEILTTFYKLNGWLILIIIAAIAGCIAGCRASIYFLFNGYAIYIGEKILRLYNKPDGEYVIISDSKWLFWLPIFYREATDIISQRLGIKAKKNGNIIELRGIKERYFPYPYNFRFIFPNFRRFDFDQFGCIYSKQAVDDRNWGRKHSEQIYDWIFFTYRGDLVSNSNVVWLFKLIRKKGDYDPPNEYYAYENAYENASEHSNNHLMGICFGGVNYSEEDKIIYNIITQIDENKIIRKDIEGDRIIEYYHNYEDKGEWRCSYSSIAKVTNTKEGFYFYSINENMFSWDFNIKKFMQMSGIYPRGLLEYGDESDGWMIYCLNGNYFRSRWHKNDYNEHIGVGKFISIAPITLEEYSKILEDDCKYQREKKNLEEKRRKIIYNIITQTSEDEIIFADSEEKEYYYYRETHPAYNNEYSSISKILLGESYYYRIKGWEFENFNIEEFMQLNDIHYEKTDEKTDYFPYYETISSYRLNENRVFQFGDRRKDWNRRKDYRILFYPIDTCKQTQTIKLEKKKSVPKSTVEYQLPRKTIALLTTIIFITFGLFLYRTIDYQNYFSNRTPLYRHIIDFGNAISSTITDYIEAHTYEMLFNRGNEYFKEGNYDQAIEDYAAVLRIKPNLSGALYNRGLTYWNKGNYHRATEDFEAVLKIDPNNVKAKENLEKIRQIKDVKWREE